MVTQGKTPGLPYTLNQIVMDESKPGQVICSIYT